MLNNSFKHINQSLSFIIFLVKYLGDISWWLICSHLTSEPDAVGLGIFFLSQSSYGLLSPFTWMESPFFPWISHFSVYRFIPCFDEISFCDFLRNNSWKYTFWDFICLKMSLFCLCSWLIVSRHRHLGMEYFCFRILKLFLSFSF